MGVNKVMLSGNLTRDPEVKVINGPKQTKVATFTIAVNKRFKKQNGEYDERAEFVFCEAWDSGAETIERIFHKGDKVFVEGSLREDTWEKDGQRHSRTKVRVTDFEKLSWKTNEGEAEGKAEEPQLEGAGVGTDGPIDEIPF